MDSMAKQLGLLANDANLRERLRVAGLAQARNFDWNRTAAETLSLYARAGQNIEKILSIS